MALALNRISIELLELIPNHLSSQRHVPAVTLHAGLPLSAEDEMHELLDSWIDRLAGVAVEKEIDVVRQGIGVVANRLQSAWHVRTAGARLDGKHSDVGRHRLRGGVTDGVRVVLDPLTHLHAPVVDLAAGGEVVGVSLVPTDEL